jgi:hypothetical protein
MATVDFSEITSILGGYSSSLDSAIKEVAEDVARDAVKKVKEASPVGKKNTTHKGRYKKGWRMKVEKGFGTIEANIYNETDYQLTHLLERPHIGKNQYGTWGTVYPKSAGHISKVQDDANLFFETEVESRIRNGL